MIENSIAAVKPELVKEWHPTKNVEYDVNVLPFDSEKYVWWQCLDNEEHYWLERVYERSDGEGCPHCLAKTILNSYLDLATTNPELAKEWHPTLNGKFTPENVSEISGRKRWWRCEKGHDWKAKVNSRRGEWTGCPYCANRELLRGYNELNRTHPELAAEWHPTLNGDLTPFDVTSNSIKRVWWQCDRGHEWKAELRHREKGWCKCPQCKKLGRFSARMHEIDKQRKQREQLENAGVQSESTPENK